MSKLSEFVIITNGRSGSNYFVDVINQHPNAFNYGEILGEWSKKRILKKMPMCKTEEKYVGFWLENKAVYWLSQIFYYFKLRPNYKIKNRKNINAVGFKDFAINIDRLGLESWLLRSEEIKVINLYRVNQLERYISLCAMKKTGVVISNAISKVDNKKILIDVEEMIESLSVFEEEKEYHKRIIEKIDKSRVFNICYEDFFEGDIDKSLMTKDMFKFIGVEPISVEGRHKKILSKSLESRISNFEEVKNRLIGGPFEKYLGL